MKILFLCKRRPQGRDLLTRPYGRFFYLPHELSLKGHESYLLLLNYRNEPVEFMKSQSITWISENIAPFSPLQYYNRACQLIESVKPDWIVGFSANVRVSLSACLCSVSAVRETAVRHICPISPVAVPRAFKVSGVLKSTTSRKSSK